MDLTELSAVVSVLKDALTATAIVVGGIWAILRFWREREAVPRLQWELGIKRVDVTAAGILLEVTAYIENKGKIRHEIGDFGFNVSILRERDLVMLQELQAYEPNVVDLRGTLMPKGAEITFIEPGVRARYCELIFVPKDTSVVYAYARFEYGRHKEYDENECTLSFVTNELSAGLQTA